MNEYINQWYDNLPYAYKLLVSNNGKTDNLINASKFLQKRIVEIKKAITDLRDLPSEGNISNGPSLKEIEDTYVMLVNAKFKPFVDTLLVSTETNIVTIPTFDSFFTDLNVPENTKKRKNEFDDDDTCHKECKLE